METSCIPPQAFDLETEYDTCHWCNVSVKNPVFFSTKLVNDYSLPVSFCVKCVPALLDWDPKAKEDD